VACNCSIGMVWVERRHEHAGIAKVLWHKGCQACTYGLSCLPNVGHPARLQHAACCPSIGLVGAGGYGTSARRVLVGCHVTNGQLCLSG
jgi:hypothetical protein